MKAPAMIPNRPRRRRAPDPPESLLSAPDVDEADMKILPELGMVPIMITERLGRLQNPPSGHEY
jgi:hypothetical protein